MFHAAVLLSRIYIYKIFLMRSVAVFPALFQSPTGQEESVTKPVLKTSHYLFCHGLGFGNFPVDRLFFLLTSTPLLLCS